MDETATATHRTIVMLVHDGDRQSSLESLLTLAGWRVLQVCDAVEAFSTVKAGRADMVMIYLPVDEAVDMDLPAVLRQICPCAYLPIVIVAEDAAEQARCEYLNSGADDVVPTQVSGRELVARLRALMRIKELHDELESSHVALEQALERERSLMARLRRDNENLQRLVTTDPLTHVQNVRSYNDLLAHEWKIAKRYNQPLSLLMMDVDHFKVVNDTYGHPAGDYMLKELAVIFKQSVRESDVVARTGGEEFSILLPKSDRAQALQFAQRIRQQVADRDFAVFGKHIRATISIGAATCPADAEIVEPQMLVYFADQCLLHAKETGRNRVVAVADLEMPLRNRIRRQYADAQSVHAGK